MFSISKQHQRKVQKMRTSNVNKKPPRVQERDISPDDDSPGDSSELRATKKDISKLKKLLGKFKNDLPQIQS